MDKKWDIHVGDLVSVVSQEGGSGLIHRFLTSLNVSWDKGIVQFAGLLLPAPSVIRGPGAIGRLANSCFH